MEILTLTILALVTASLLWYLINKINTGKTEGKCIPGPPFLAGLRTFLKGSMEEHLHLYMQEWAQKYGDIFEVNLMAKKVVFVNDVSLFQRLVKSVEFRDFTNDRPPTFFGKHYAGGWKDIIFANGGPELKYRRRLFHGLLKFYGEGVGEFENIMVTTLTELVKDLHTKDKVNLPMSIKNYILNLVGFLCTGDVSEKAQKNLPKIKAYSDWIVKIAQFSHDLIQQVFPFLCYIPGSRFKEYDKGMEKATNELRESYFEDMKRTFDPQHKRGLIDEMISTQLELEKEGLTTRLDDECIVALIQDVVAAAYVTTSSSLAILFLQLIQHQDIQDKIYAEIQSVIGESIPSFQHKSKMPYTEAVILETLRYASTVPLLVPHACNQDIVFEGYHISKSTILMMNAFYNHHRPDYWDDPFAFKPDRFLTPDGQLVDITHPARQRLIPFGSGPRSCPGEMFAKSRMFLITTFLVKAFHFMPDPTVPLPSDDPRHWPGSGAICPDDYTCVLQDRM